MTSSAAPAVLSDAGTPAHLDLAGHWQCRLDRQGVGEQERWFAAPLGADSVEIQLPGSLQHQGIGDPVTLETQWVGGVVDQSFFTADRYAPYRDGEELSVPFWLQPRVAYMGAAWYQREIEIPQGWDDRTLELELERVHWESTLWLDRNRLGSRHSLTTAHRYDLGLLTPGRHRLTLRIDNRTIIDVGPNSHAVSDHTQGNWNGVIGTMRLTPRSEVRLGRVRVFPDVAASTLEVRTDIVTGLEGVEEGLLEVTASREGVVVASAQVPFEVGVGRDFGSRGLLGSGTHLDLVLELGKDAVTWDEFTPALYDLEVSLRARAGGRPQDDTQHLRVGLREVGVEETQVSVNGRRTFLRGTLECCVFPLTGYPPTDVPSWRRIMDVVKAHGLNLLRMHSWCPPEAAFLAADEAGVYLQIESPVWANQGAGLGEGRPVDAFIHDETRRILQEYGNHPSFLMMAHGNEPGGRDSEFLAAWVSMYRASDPRRLYTSAAGWPAIPENDFDNIPEPRAHRWGEGLESRLNAQAPNTLADYTDWVESRPRPIVSHEIGQWCVHPNLGEMQKYTGLMQPKNFGIFRDFLDQAGMLDQADDFLHASGRLQALCYKEDIESALRTEGFAGFHLLGLSDFPGQGTAMVGVLDAFWEEKGYCSPDEFSRFCGPTVPLARLQRRIWRAAEQQSFDVQLAHFGRAPLVADVRWRLVGEGGLALAEGVVAEQAEIEIGNGTFLQGTVIPAGLVEQPTQAALVVTVEDSEGWRAENDWNVWIYPDVSPDTPPGIMPGSSLDTSPGISSDAAPVALDIRATADVDEAIALADAGATVLLEVPGESLPDDIALGFTPVFWNTAWTSGQAPHTLGLFHDPEHPVFGQFPTGGATDWQWWAALSGARPLRLDALPAGARPIVQVIDTWFEARRLAVLLEARLGEGRIMISSLNLAGGGEERLSAQQLRRSLLAYMGGPDFSPQITLDAAQIRSTLLSRG